MATMPITDPVAEFLTTLGITYATQYRGEQVDKSGGRPWVHDLWACQFSKGAEHYGRCPTHTNKPGSQGNRLCTCPRRTFFETPFRTGTGHRRTPPEQSSWIKVEDIPVAPFAGVVLGALIMDGAAASESFYDWCSELGYETDSLKHLAVYNECGEVYRKLRSFFAGDWQKVCNFLEGFEDE